MTKDSNRIRYLLAFAMAFFCGWRSISAQQMDRNSAIPAGCLSPLGMSSAECQGAFGDNQNNTPDYTPNATLNTPLNTVPSGGPNTAGSRRVLRSQQQPNVNNNVPSGRQQGEGPLSREDLDQPEEPTEFQRFATTSVGEVLPIFGASLFKGVPSTFAPVDRIPVTADYVVGPGDEVLLRAWGQVNADLDLTVDRAGGIFVPQVGNISLAGLQFGQVPGYLRGQFGRVYRNFDLNVNMGQLRSIQVFVVGQARRPGAYTVSSLSTLLNALFASGGPSSRGSMRHIQLKRGAQVASEFDLYDLLLKGDKSKDLRLMPGDVIYIPVVGPQIAVAGSVRNPGVYELSGETEAADVIQMAGGMPPTADAQQGTLERIDQRGSRMTYNMRLDKAGLTSSVGDGDILRILAIAPRFRNAVTLRGNVANPGRFAWHEGMRLRDIIPDKESLLTRDYWTQRNTLGSVHTQKIMFTGNDPVTGKPTYAFTGNDPVTGKPTYTTTLGQEDTDKEKKREPTVLGVIPPDINWSYAVIERQRERDLNVELISFNLGKLVIEGDETQNLELRPADVVTVFSQADIRVASAQQSRFVKLEGEFISSGMYMAEPGETLGHLIQRSGGLTSQAYLYASEFIRESTRADQERRLGEFMQELEQQTDKEAANRANNAGTIEEAAAVTKRVEAERHVIERLKTVKATGRIILHLEPGSNDLSKLMNVQLENGDRFVVPPKPSTVNILGAVYNQNSFLHEPQLRIGDYLRQAGGTTRTADQSHVFVIRADGSVTPKTGSGPFTKTFEANRLNPGDSVVVPEALFKTTFLKGLRDWSQVFGQLALGAAAINVLK